VSVTQQLDTVTWMDRLVLNLLLSSAEFEREIIAERTRDILAAMQKSRSMAVGGVRSIQIW
jgi:DNA invertase Pin-like site-specific DNA recombinase